MAFVVLQPLTLNFLKISKIEELNPFGADLDIIPIKPRDRALALVEDAVLRVTF